MTQNFCTADLVDKHGDNVHSCIVQFPEYGGRRQFVGSVRVVKTLEDNALIEHCP
jgi:regulator of ribonuclease activity A